MTKIRKWLHKLGVCWWNQTSWGRRHCRLCKRKQVRVVYGAVGSGIKEGWV